MLYSITSGVPGEINSLKFYLSKEAGKYPSIGHYALWRFYRISAKFYYLERDLKTNEKEHWNLFIKEFLERYRTGIPMSCDFCVPGPLFTVFSFKIICCSQSIFKRRSSMM